MITRKKKIRGKGTKGRKMRGKEWEEKIGVESESERLVSLRGIR